jgi:uncharacterized phage protein gp47/JayE
MPLRIPSFRNVVERARADITQQLPDADPTIAGSLLRVLVESVAARIHAFNLQLQQVARQLFPQTAEDEFLERWAVYEGLSRGPASVSTGDIVFSGSLNSVVPIGTQLTSATGEVFELQAEVSLTNQVITITSLTRSGNTVTAIAAGHSLASGMAPTISGANQAAYNGVHTVAVIDEDTFTYEIASAPATPATGTILASFVGAAGTVVSADNGIDQNLLSGARLTLSTPISGVTAAAFVRVDGITGGTDVETDDALRARVMESRANPTANFSPTEIEKRAKSVIGVTRVKVNRATPDPGDVTVLFVRDGDANIIPSAADIEQVRLKLLEILPATSEEDALIVDAPDAVDVNFNFTAISPNTQSMKDAIAATLEAFFQDEVQIEVSITEDQIRSSIIQTIDTETGFALQSFTLSTPTADIPITAGNIARLGTVTFV